MSRSGEKPTPPGIYRSDCCAQDIALRPQEALPRCPKCGKDASWTLAAQLEGMQIARDKDPRAAKSKENSH